MNLSVTPEAKEHLASDLSGRVLRIAFTTGCGAAMLIPFVAWYLGISLWAALMMDISIVAFYLVYAFVFNIAYDRVFPVRELSAHGRRASRALPA